MLLIVIFLIVNKTMKKISLITIFYLLIANFSFAASYPASCPTEAKAIVDAVGGCSAVDKNIYSAVYNKCCVNSVTSDSKPIISNPAPVTPAKTTAPALKSPASKIAPVTKPLPGPHGEPLEKLPSFPQQLEKNISSSTVPAVTNVAGAGARAAEKIKNAISSFLRFFRFR